MYTEAAEAATVVQHQLDRNAGIARRVGRKLREIDPGTIVTVARGSSDHAACYAKYLIETRVGVITSSAGPSVYSVYETPMKLAGSVFLIFSQSGASPDLLAVAEAARKGGAYLVALVNVSDSPLSDLADEVLELHAGPETSVAATKSFIASLSAAVQLTTAWQSDPDLDKALAGAPESLHQAWGCDWNAAIEPVSRSGNLYVLGRGLGLGIAYEAALKFKEVCGLHAEAFSSAEVLHGPVTIAREDFPVLVMAQNDASFPGISNLVGKLAKRGVKLITAGLEHECAINLPSVVGHPVIEPILRIQSFYRMANALSVRLGQDPDSPPYLNKVTSTL
jgi:glucosamine--fructose-6-phosphate aminotransferase (isomerizing)